MFHFETGGCRKGGECPYSHSQSTHDSSKARKNSRSKSPGGDKRGKKDGKARASTPGPGKKGTCFLFQNGRCPHGKNCKFVHDHHSTSPAPSKSSQKATPVVVDEFFMSDTEEEQPSQVHVAAGRRTERRVRFCKSKPDILKYVCPDLVGGMPNSQTKNGKGRFQEHITEGDLLDVFYKRQASLSQVIARAKGMLMDQSENMNNLREVRIILCSDSNRAAFHRIVHDQNSDDLSFVQTTEQVKSRMCSHDAPDVLCLTVPILERDRRCTLDSASGHDLISQRKVNRMELDTFTCEEICFHSNTTTSTATQTTIDMGTFTKKPQGYVLQDTPSVMSLGKHWETMHG